MRREKSEKLSRSPATPTGWEDIQHFLPRNVGRIDVVRRHENDFVSMLLKIFIGPCELPLPPAVFSEPFLTIQERREEKKLEAAIRRWKNDKGGKHVPYDFLIAL